MTHRAADRPAKDVAPGEFLLLGETDRTFAKPVAHLTLQERGHGAGTIVNLNATRSDWNDQQ